MRATDIATWKRTFQPGDVAVALALLTRLPLSQTPSAARKPADAAWAYPLVGLVTGLVALAVGWVLLWLGASAPVTAFFVLLALIMSTGAMHEDGLADCADGFWGGWTVERRLEIMRDSRIGTYGVIALVLSLSLRWYLLTVMIDTGTLAGAVLVAVVVSRAAMVWVMYRVPPARTSGLSAQTGRPGGLATCAALGIAFAAAVLAPEVSALWLVVFAVLVTLAVGQIARWKVGGQTGDVLGAVQQVVEITVLIGFDIMSFDWEPA